MFVALLLGVYFPILGFLGLAFAIAQRRSIVDWDVRILQGIHQTATPQLDRWAIALTQFGVTKGVIPGAILLGIFLLYRALNQAAWRPFTYWSMTLLSAAVANRTAKFFFHRPRPYLWGAVPADFSFPSGHAMSSMILAIALTLLVWRSPWRWLILSLGLGFAVIIGWTRLYLGLHFPSDILAGWLLAIALAMGFLALLNLGMK